VPRERFLRTVVRNFARRFRRDEATRQRHEQAGARLEQVPASDELAAREQLRCRVADAVLALDEPYRTTVALVYLEEQPPAVAAARLGVAEATVRVRLNRAREQLRRRLDRDFGTRGTWAAVVLWGRQPTTVPTSSLAFGVLAMKKTVSVAVVAVLLLAVGSFVVARWHEPGTTMAPESAAVVIAVAPMVPDSPAAMREVAAMPSTTPPLAAPAIVQQFHCRDEQGQPVANAEVRIVRMPWGSGVPDASGHTDAAGLAEFHDLATATYSIRAREGHRHYVADIDHTTVALPAPRIDIELRELWIGGIRMPGCEVVTWQAGYAGFTHADDQAAERDLAASWRVTHPDAVFAVAVRNPRRVLADTIDVEVHWFGRRPHKQDVRMWPVSLFPGPESVDPAAVPTCDWANTRVVLTDPAGVPLPEVLQVVLRERADLQGGHGGIGERRPRMNKTFKFRNGTVRLPAGDYELRFYEARNSTMVPVATCTVARDTTELLIAVATKDRIVRLHVRGLDAASYMLQIVHESGHTVREFGRANGEHTLLLPPGPCIATLNRQLPNGLAAPVEYVFTVGEKVEQEVTWDVPPLGR